MAAVLTHLPPEILHHIFSYADPEDLTRIPLVCRFLNNFIKGNNALCRAIYLRILDEPPTRDLNFEQELHDIIFLKSLCPPNGNTREHEIKTRLPFIYRTITRLLNHAVTVPATATTATKESTSTSTTSVSNKPQPARQSRAQTFPPSLNAAFLTTLFNSPSARLNILSRSFLYERGRAMQISGMDDNMHYLDWYPSESGSESDPHESDTDLEPPGPGPRPHPRSRRRRPRRSYTPYGWRKPRRVREAYQMSAKLHCLYGWSLALEDRGGISGRVATPVPPGSEDGDAMKRAVWLARRGGGAYALACAKVFDLREHTRGTQWGPFLDADAYGGDGGGGGVRVDWEKVEAILVVLGTNIRSKGLERFPIFRHFWGKPFAGCWGGSYIPWSRDREQGKEKGLRELDRGDPYGVSGSWLRVVSFLDYSDFFHFNFPIVDRLPRDVPRAPLNVGQATRLILMRMRVTKVEPAGAGDHPDYPVTYFQGFSRALDGSWDNTADADIRGTVRVTPEGEVRWTSYSEINGEERWKSEGVQIGGVRSARGVVGNWFDKDYNVQGPCGPTAFWKISDRESTGEGPQVLLEDLFPLIADDLDKELVDYDEDGIESGDEFVLEALDPLGADWADYELEDEMDAVYFFDDEDVFDVEDLEGELEGLAEVEGEDEDEDEEGVEDDDEVDDEEGEEEGDEEDPESAGHLIYGWML
ncbi:hypothetical protein C8A00DRAFT_40754 [Chaetomidium leptoderma]|uniref:F-box domain-containing protein n=1 Tax=Chaetomidium leptoderma TaxID=669021 RepID=A0AAN7A0D7_9PEZI|nr:hypothetical protein C8A00DRAFT_40754 [Chaetomidium leptoderma]